MLAFAGLVVVAVEAESDDAPALIDNGTVAAAVVDACTRMTTRLDAELASAEPSRVLRWKAQQIDRFIRDVTRLDPQLRAGDEPLEDWLRDWRALSGALRDHADRIADEAGSPADFDLPTDPDGEDITVRMDEVAQTVCPVPETVTDPLDGVGVDVTDV